MPITPESICPLYEPAASGDPSAVRAVLGAGPETKISPETARIIGEQLKKTMKPLSNDGMS